MLRIRDVYPGSEFFHPGSTFLSIFNPKHCKLSGSGMFIPDRVRILIFLHIPDPRSRGQKGTGSRIRNTAINNICVITWVPYKKKDLWNNVTSF